MKDITTQKWRRKPGRPKQKNSEMVEDGSLSARERLLDAAALLFAEQGVSATSLAKVASEAGLTSAMVHYYFTNKDQLIEAVVEERLARFLSRVLEEGFGENKVDYLISLIPRLAIICRDNPWLPSLWVREIVGGTGTLRGHVLKILPPKVLNKVMTTYGENVENSCNQEVDNVGLLFFTVISNFLLPLAAKDLLEQIPGVGTLDIDMLANHAVTVLRHGLGKN